MHTGASRVNELRGCLNEFAGADRSRKVHIADVRGHAIVAAVAGGTGVTGLVDPFENAPRLNAQPITGLAGGSGEKTKRDAVVHGGDLLRQHRRSCSILSPPVIG